MNRIDITESCVDTLTAVRRPSRDDQAGQGVPVTNPPDASESSRVLAAKLSLPHQGFVLRRPRLRALAEPARAGGLVSLVAGPGYGKTAFIVDLLSTVDGETVYYAVDESDRDPVSFLRCLMAGLGMKLTEPRVTPVFGWPGQGGARGASLELVAELLEFMSGTSGTSGSSWRSMMFILSILLPRYWKHSN